MASCPALSTVTKDTLFITIDNVTELLTSTDKRTAGTSVTVTCNSGYVLQGSSSVTCQPDGTWSYTTKPRCIQQNATTAAPDAGGLDNTSKIVIGVAAGIGSLIIIALIIMIIFIYLKDQRIQAEKKDLIENLDNHPRRDYSRSGPSTIEMSESPPQRDMFYRGDPYNSRADLQLGHPVYLPDYPRDTGRGYPDDYDDRPADWRKSVLEERDWGYRRDGRAHVHGGRYPARDPFLWRNVRNPRPYDYNAYRY